jgi:MYXO-CTERM domain-containing protein
MRTNGTARHSLTSFVIVALALLAPRAAHAFCGFYVSGADAKLFNNATQVVLMRDGQRTVLSMQNNYEGPPEGFALVVPVPVVLQKENVKTLPRAIFDRVDQLTSPRLVEYWEQDPCYHPELSPAAMPSMAKGAMAPSGGVGGASFGVTIEAQFTVGEYEIVILSAKDATGLDIWLHRSGYKIPDGAEPYFRPYVAGGSKFFVAKVDPQKVTFENGQAMLSPLRFFYDSDTFSLPIRLGLINSHGPQDLIVDILAMGQRYEVANYDNVTIPTNLDVAEGAKEQFGALYAALFDKTLEEHPRAVVTEYSWDASSCDPCPTPALSMSELATLGADTLVTAPPATPPAGPRPVLDVASQARTGADNDPVKRVAMMHYEGLTRCFDAEASDPSARGRTILTFTVDPNGAPSDLTVTGEQPRNPRLDACITRQAKTWRVPAEAAHGLGRVLLTYGARPQAAVPPWMRGGGGFVVTRLHARYTRDTLGEDLVFRAASPIQGGRESFAQQGGVVEKGARPGAINNFQARYAIRHPWSGPLTCANPVRGRWGGPPTGIDASSTETATKIAFAPRGAVALASLLREDLPDLGVKADIKNPMPPPPSGATPADTSVAAPGSSSAAPRPSACGCGVAGEQRAPTPGILAALGLALLAERRRRSGARGLDSESTGEAGSRRRDVGL